MQNRRSSVLITLLVIGLALLGIRYFYATSRGPRINFGPYEALGMVAAEETAKLIGNQGRIVLISKGAGESRDPVMDAQLKTFTKVLTSQSDISIMARETVTMNPMMRMSTGGAMPRDQFLRALDQHSDADAIVLFIGFPALVRQDLAMLEKSSQKFIVISAHLPGYKNLLSKGLIQLAIVPRFEKPAETVDDPATLRDLFDQQYVVVTPENYNSLPY